MLQKQEIQKSTDGKKITSLLGLSVPNGVSANILRNGDSNLVDEIEEIVSDDEGQVTGKKKPTKRPTAAPKTAANNSGKTASTKKTATKIPGTAPVTNLEDIKEADDVIVVDDVNSNKVAKKSSKAESVKRTATEDATAAKKQKIGAKQAVDSPYVYYDKPETVEITYSPPKKTPNIDVKVRKSTRIRGKKSNEDNKKEIADAVVKYLMSYYKQKKIANKDLFKKLARFITAKVVDTKPKEIEASVQEYVGVYFEGIEAVNSEADILGNTAI